MTEPTGDVIDAGGIYLSFGMDEDGDDIVGVTIHGGLAVITILGLLDLGRESVLRGQYTQMSEEDQ